MDEKMLQEIKNISTEELINELENRNLFDELPIEKQQWLKAEGHIQITKFQFTSINNENLYSLKYIKKTDLEVLKSKLEIFKKRQSTAIDRLKEI